MGPFPALRKVRGHLQALQANRVALRRMPNRNKPAVLKRYPVQSTPSPQQVACVPGYIIQWFLAFSRVFVYFHIFAEICCIYLYFNIFCGKSSSECVLKYSNILNHTPNHNILEKSRKSRHSIVLHYVLRPFENEECLFLGFA